MTEPTVQVPVSQIERAARLLISSGFNQMGGELRMMLSQKNPATELHDLAGTIEAELEYRVRTVVSRVRATDKHSEPYPKDWVNNEITQGRERVRALLSPPFTYYSPWQAGCKETPHD